MVEARLDFQGRYYSHSTQEKSEGAERQGREEER
jgi:hypothetical protein